MGVSGPRSKVLAAAAGAEDEAQELVSQVGMVTASFFRRRGGA
jgi:hypothetical protein